MHDVFDYAKYIIQKEPGSFKNTFDGNMRLQKLLVFANLISLAEYGEPLFDDPVLAFAHGCVIERIRLRYKNDYQGLMNDSLRFSPAFSREESDALDLAVSLFGGLRPREMSDINHTFRFWENAYNNSIQPGGFKDKGSSVISVESMIAEAGRMKDVANAYRETEAENSAKETINGIDFYYDPSEFAMTDDLLDYLYDFSLEAGESAYSVYFDRDHLVVY